MEAAQKVLPLERTVDCECDSRLARPVLYYNYASETSASACLCCGRVTCYYSLGDEPRGAGEVGGANFVVPVPDEVTDWLGKLPRLLTLGRNSDDPIWAAADVRCPDWDRLKQLTEEQTQATASVPPGRRLAQLHVPDVAFPSLPDGKWAQKFAWLIALHESLRMPEDTPVEELLRQARPGTPTYFLALERLLQRPDRETLLVDGLRAAESLDWSTWLAVLYWDRPPRRATIAALGEGLSRLPLTSLEGATPHVRQQILLHDLLAQLIELRVPSEWCENELKAFQERVGKQDWDLVAAISRTRRTLTTQV